MKTIILGLFIILTMLLMSSVYADINDAQRAFDKNDYTTALKEARPLAEEGNPAAQYLLGSMYQQGHGVPKDLKQAREWYLKSANQGQIKAQNQLGLLYENGLGVPQDYSQALSWYLKAAAQGSPEAQDSVGYFYHNGKGVNKDDSQALAWIKKAADQGFAGAQFNLGTMYARGDGTSTNEAEAITWFRKSADQGFAPAQFAMGVAYEQGRGVSKNRTFAIVWYQKAAQQGHEDAKEALAKLVDPPPLQPSEIQAVFGSSNKPKQTQDPAVLDDLIVQAKMCMSEGIQANLRLGNRSREDIASFITQTCGAGLSNYMTHNLNQPAQQVNTFIRAMAYDQLLRTPGIH